jgi:hypothetical protein
MQPSERDYNQAPPSTQMPVPQSMLESRPPSQAAIADTGRSKPPIDPLVVVAGKAVKLDNSNRDQIAKLPVAFGYSLADSGVSKALALAATQNWYESGKLAAAVEINSKGSRKGMKGPPTDVINGKEMNNDNCREMNHATPESRRGDARKDKRIIRKQKRKEKLKARRMEKSIERKRRREENNPSSSNSTPKSTSGTSPDCKMERKRKGEEKNPSSSNSTPKSASGTSPICKSVKKGKSGNKPSIGKPKSSGASPSGSEAAATLIASSDSPPGLPTGWKMKTFRRMAGKSAGNTDSYWYSPQLMHRFRSMKGCKLFIEILNEPGIAGDESVAFNQFKKRGFRL